MEEEKGEKKLPRADEETGECPLARGWAGKSPGGSVLSLPFGELQMAKQPAFCPLSSPQITALLPIKIPIPIPDAPPTKP